ncbi:MAG TPA: hypothetical protein VHK47_16945 [Polyangia bacterium]|jgi:hypothetical protein|nr:hypothetical protein [Polyangia bacterium]
MSLSRLRAHLVPALVLTAAFSLAGCKQSNGERCEIDSDCASGICGPSGAAVGMTSAAGLRCVAMLGGGTVIDAGTGGGSDAADAPVDGAGAEVSPEAGTDAETDGGDASTEAGADAAATDGLPSADGATDGAAAGG